MMGIRLFKRNQKTVSIVFSDRSIRFMEVALGEQPKILRWAEHLLGNDLIRDGKIVDQSLRLILEECVETWGIKRRTVQFLVPDLYINIRTVNVPRDVRDDELNGYIFLEIGSSIHLPFEDPVFDAKVLAEKDKEKEVLLVAAQNEVVNAYVQLLDDVKLKPVAADISPLALYRLYHHSGMTTGKEHIMLLHFDADLLTLSIFHNDIPIFVKPLPIQKESISIQIGESTTHPELNYLEDAFLEIEKIMNFYSFTLNHGKASVERIFLSGDLPELDEVMVQLTERLPLKIEQLKIEQYLTSEGQPLRQAFLPVLGLALKEVTP